MSSTVPSVEFSDAKVHLSDVMTKVVYGRQPRLVRRHRGKEEMILLRPDDLARSLNSFRFHPHLSVRKGEATAELPEVGILGFGTSADEAMTDLVEELRAYARRFFERTELLPGDRPRCPSSVAAPFCCHPRREAARPPLRGLSSGRLFGQMRTPTWSQVEAFCRKDGWEEIRETDHVFYRRVLENGTVLETHRSFSTKKTMRGRSVCADSANPAES